jgi:hypothetical protein
MTGALPSKGIWMPMIDQTPSDYRDRMHQMLGQVLEASSQRDVQRRFEEVS